MAKAKNSNGPEAVHSFRFTLKGLILFTLFLVAGTALVSSRLVEAKSKLVSFQTGDGDAADKSGQPAHTGAWGELETQDILLERPFECIAAEDVNPPPELWNFKGLTPASVRKMLIDAGLTAAEVDAQMSPAHLTITATNLAVLPDESFLLSLSAEKRRKIYDTFYGLGLGAPFDYPMIFSPGTSKAIYADPRLNPADLALLKKLAYPEANEVRLTDYNLLIRQIPTVERRMTMAKVLTLTPAVLPRLYIHPNSDIDKIATYWARIDNVHFNDVRQIMEALKKLPAGGAVSLTYLLPPFARSRLYTFPMPKQPGDPIMDCHWSTFNFDKLQLDNGFNNPNYTSEYLIKNLYQIDSPGIFGDVLFFTDGQGIFQHSAVYIADDLYFNKYGYDSRAPWIITHFADIQAMYPKFKPVFYRRRED